MGPDSRPVRRSDVLAQAAGETVILLTPDSGEYFTLNEVGGRIWELADGSRSVAEIAGVLVEEYEAPLADIEADALELLGELAGERLVSDGRDAA
jgi:hypothetical protein